jgi:hypothetical protein
VCIEIRIGQEADESILLLHKRARLKLLLFLLTNNMRINSFVDSLEKNRFIALRGADFECI